MNVVRNMRVPALATLLLIALSPALAWADMDTGDALATFFLVFLGEAVAVAVGLGAVIAALLLRSRAVWVFALLMAAANGVMGAAVLFQGAGRLSLFTNLASLQVTLALFACPSLVAWRRTEREDRAPVAASLHTPHWLLLWILGHAGVGIVASSVAFPLTAGLMPHDPRDAANSLRAVLVVTGLVNGGLIGVMQWLLLRHSLHVGGLWIALTALGSAAAGFITTALSAQLAGAALIGGAVLGVAQWPLLRERIQKAWVWILISALIGLVHWPAASLYVSAPAAAPVVLHAVGGLMALVTGLVLQRLAPPVANRP